jgi:hypothetical protein
MRTLACQSSRDSVVAQFELCISQGVIPKSPRSYQRAEGSPVAHRVVTGDPSLRLKNGYARDAIDERRCHQKFKMSHYRSRIPASGIQILNLKSGQSSAAVSFHRLEAGQPASTHWSYDQRV